MILYDFCLLPAQSGLESYRGQILRPHYLSREDHNRKIRPRKQRTDIGKFSFLNRTIISWNQLPTDLIPSFPFKLNKFRKRVKKLIAANKVKS
jgi:hypothetical protein